MTNYERIKAMSIKEMAVFIAAQNFMNCDGCERGDREICTNKECCNIKKKWLESEWEDKSELIKSILESIERIGK